MKTLTEPGRGSRAAAANQPRGVPVDGREIRVARSIVLYVLVIGVGLIIAAGLTSALLHHALGYETALGFVDQFDLDQEANVPAWFAAMLLLACAVLLFAIYLAKRHQGDPWAPWWAGLAVIFLYLSADEASGLHELTFRAAHAFLELTGGLYVGWVIPFGALLCVLAVLYLRFLLHLPRRYRTLFVLAGVLYVGGAGGMEMVSWHHRWTLMEAAPGDLEAKLAASNVMSYALLAVVEEAMELIGTAIFLYALLCYLAEHRVGTEIRFEPPSPAAPAGIVLAATSGATAALRAAPHATRR